MKKNYSLLIAILITCLGFVTVVTAAISPLQLLTPQILLVLVGAAFISSGFVLFVQARDKKKAEKRDEERHQQIMDKLEKLEQEMAKLENPKDRGVVIADILGAGLKYYGEHLSPPKEEGKKDD